MEKSKDFFSMDKDFRHQRLSTLGELAGEISHDFNNSLTTILGFSQIVMNDKRLDKDLKSYMEMIYESALDGEAIVSRIKNFSKNEKSDNMSLIEVNDVVESTIKMASIKWKNINEKKGMKIEVIENLQSKSKINCNAREIREITLNIILNAIDSLENGGQLKIETYDEDDNVVIKIQDTGIGMDEETMSNIFEPFFSTKGENGTGLGLSICKKIIEKHNGIIKVDSKLGVGTTFRIYMKRYSVDIV